MPVELRIPALALLALAALAVAPSLGPWAWVALAIAIVGLVPPMPPMVNGLAAVLAGATIAAAATAPVGLVALLVAPLAVASLRLGWRPAVWAAGLAIVLAALVVPDLAAVPAIAPCARAWVVAASLPIWLVVQLRLARNAAPQIA